ncbi:helix-turn-helix domain-containing protein [Streptomyces kunmingensis]|uniref:Helix-turn-helix domain-containing protein n=1 Tax=Streptomyces kunmingensis TaxID=68225 RepID=A0ABU6C3I6_9ACTN|nr:helix-turn-helix domain-containing protein [Streptomyces kunmingensis]MEB3958761.1 helix-turn-helix domain-containing protein [Streptomyces kunmingensis]
MGKQVNTPSQAAAHPAPDAPPPAGGAPGPVDKALEVLSALVATGAPHRLADLSRRTGLAKPTVHRLLRSLAAAGFAEPGENGSYRPGPALLGLAAAVLGEEPLLTHVRPVLDELRARTGQFASFAVRDREWLVHVEVRSHGTGLALGPRPGEREHLTAGACGLLVRALTGEPAESGDPTAADPSVRETHDDAEELARAAQNGWALDPADPNAARRALAVAVRAPDGTLAGVLALSGPVFTFDDASAEIYAPLALSAARSIEAGLAAAAPPRLGLVAEADNGRSGGGWGRPSPAPRA